MNQTIHKEKVANNKQNNSSSFYFTAHTLNSVTTPVVNLVQSRFWLHRIRERSGQTGQRRTRWRDQIPHCLRNNQPISDVGDQCSDPEGQWSPRRIWGSVDPGAERKPRGALRDKTSSLAAADAVILEGTLRRRSAGGAWGPLEDGLVNGPAVTADGLPTSEWQTSSGPPSFTGSSQDVLASAGCWFIRLAVY